MDVVERKDGTIAVVEDGVVRGAVTADGDEYMATFCGRILCRNVSVMDADKWLRAAVTAHESPGQDEAEGNRQYDRRPFRERVDRKRATALANAGRTKRPQPTAPSAHGFDRRSLAQRTGRPRGDRA